MATALAGVLLVAMLLWPAMLRAQTPPTLDTARAVQCTVGCEVLRGVVYDSLTQEPLISAMIVAKPGGVFATTDSFGRFELVHDGPVALVTAYHEALAQVGLDGLRATRPVDAASWDTVTLATPSLQTIWPKLCGQPLPRMARTRILTGTARLDDGSTRVAGARVLVQWPRPSYARGGSDPRQEQTTTDSLGNYLVCGIEEFVDPSMVALSVEARSGIVLVPPSTSPINRVDLLLGRTDAAPGVVQGRLIDPDGNPARGMYVTVDGAVEEAVTAADGRFRFIDVPTGSRMLMVRGIGFSPLGQMVEVTTGAMEPLTIVLTKIVSLPGVVVTEKADIRREYAEFQWRRRAGLARIVDSAEIASAPHLRAALQTVPGIRVLSRERRATLEFEIFGQRDCQASVLLDGAPADLGMVNALPKENVAAVEVYRSGVWAPPRFSNGFTCAVVLFWTKRALAP